MNPEDSIMTHWTEDLLADPEMADCQFGAKYIRDVAQCSSLKTFMEVPTGDLKSMICTRKFVEHVFGSLPVDEKEESIQMLKIRNREAYQLPVGVMMELKRISKYVKHQEKQAGGYAEMEYVCDRPETKIKTEHPNVELPDEYPTLSIKLE